METLRPDKAWPGTDAVEEEGAEEIMSLWRRR